MKELLHILKTENGLLGVCKVGAMNVGRISLAYENIITNKTFRKKKEFFYSEEHKKNITIGNEIGVFNLGSTIILLFEKDMVEFENFAVGSKIRMGEKIGIFK